MNENGEPTAAEKVAAQIQWSLRLLVFATAVLFVLLAGMGVWTFSEANRNGDALCALRSDLEVRVASSREFLREHPKGIPGISAQTIRTGIENQARTIDALRGLSC